MHTIDNVFSIGYRCNTDTIMEKLKIRKYSGPFSYMVIDLQTAVHFINNKFNNYLDVVFFEESKHNFMWKDRKWKHDLYFNKLFIPNECKINTLKRICVWNHHNLNDSDILSSIRRRIHRFLQVSNNLYIYFSQTLYSDKQINDYIELIKTIYSYKINQFLLIIPYINHKNNPKLQIIDNISIIYIKPSFKGNDNDINNIDLDNISKIIKQLYVFT